MKEGWKRIGKFEQEEEEEEENEEDEDEDEEEKEIEEEIEEEEVLKGVSTTGVAGVQSVRDADRERRE